MTTNQQIISKLENAGVTTLTPDEVRYIQKTLEERATLSEVLCKKLEESKIELSGEPLEDWEGDIGFVNGLTDAQLIIKETLV